MINLYDSEPDLPCKMHGIIEPSCAWRKMMPGTCLAWQMLVVLLGITIQLVHVSWADVESCGETLGPYLILGLS